MQLTSYSDYSLRVLIYLAVRATERATIEEIAATYGISKGHLMKVVHKLGLAGYVKTVRGRSGGLRLALAPEQIRVGEVIRHTEATMALVECFNPQGRCRIEAACGLRLILKEAFGAFLRTLDSYTLADVIAHRREALSRALAS